MSINDQKTLRRKFLLAPAATASLLLLAACGQSESPEPDAPETEETEAVQSEETDAGAPEDATEEEDAEAEAPEDATDDEDAEAGESAEGVLTMEEVEQNDSPDSCWTVMSGTVYDLTDWIDQHPGGADRIEGLCGTDAAAAFEAQHGDQDGPEGQLAEFEIGTLAD
ncbi:monooxygenase [Nesterenkonia sp. AN1]|uniref:cytochrome b5 domain-containing protein n=1 Tax=Nesterenkonia sp. AN1 TaxID=652017 RepID=UPI00044D1807|nr:cytochrome b5-like heme/steroid binding domain-containing protein [Nesterenkonia sp. AN1]EXF25107.1 monooxygenase [Nesterenkonia sp. AN1]